MSITLSQSTGVDILGYKTTLGDVGFLLSLIVATLTMIAFFIMIVNKHTLEM